jgi:quinone-modifying oxidoreductase subunit QmoA
MTDEHTPVSGGILVVGGGISGLTAALEAAEVGTDVFLVERNPYLGGRVAQLNQYFPKLCPPSCGAVWRLTSSASRTTGESGCIP